MKKRVIGGAGFVVFYVLFIMSSFFPAMLLAFAIIGCTEGYNIVKDKHTSIKYMIAYLILFLIGLVSMGFITYHNPGLMLYVSCLTMFSDTFAYFVGSKFGKIHFTKISPNKTVEGALGGFILGIIATNLLMFILMNTNFPAIQFLDFNSIHEYNVFPNLLIQFVTSFLIVVSGLFGDILESFIKRKYKVKDSGTIVYGHGGILDRLDSWIIASIFVATIMLF